MVSTATKARPSPPIGDGLRHNGEMANGGTRPYLGSQRQLSRRSPKRRAENMAAARKTACAFPLGSFRAMPALLGPTRESRCSVSVRISEGLGGIGRGSTRRWVETAISAGARPFADAGFCDLIGNVFDRNTQNRFRRRRAAGFSAPYVPDAVFDPDSAKTEASLATMASGRDHQRRPVKQPFPIGRRVARRISFRGWGRGPAPFVGTRYVSMRGGGLLGTASGGHSLSAQFLAGQRRQIFPGQTSSPARTAIGVERTCAPKAPSPQGAHRDTWERREAGK